MTPAALTGHLPTRGKETSAAVELLVNPDLDGVRLEKAVRRLALLLVGDVADDDRHHEVALVGNGDALGVALGAVLEPVLVEAWAGHGIGDSGAACRRPWLANAVAAIAMR